MDMDVTIKLEKNIETITKLNEEVHSLHHNRHPDIFKPYNYETMYKMFDEMLKKEATYCYVIYKVQEPIGYAILIERDYNRPLFQENHKAILIDQMCVIRKYRSKGLGRQLIEKIKGFSKQNGYNRIELGVWNDNTNAINFYKKMGFENYLIHMCLELER